jgi:hypothetical protein
MEQPGRRTGVSERRGRGGLGANGAVVNLPWLAFGVGINKHGEVTLAERFGELWSKLMAGDDFDFLTGEGSGEQAAGVPTNCVVTSQGVPVPNNQHFAHSHQLSAIRYLLSDSSPFAEQNGLTFAPC